jgi:hypothetical protein
MEHKAEAAALLHAADLETFRDPLLDLGNELFPRELARGVRVGVVFLGHSHDEFEMHVQPKLEQGLGGINHGGGQGLARWQVPPHCGLVRIRGQRYGWGCHDGFEDVCFHKYMFGYRLNCVTSVALIGAAFNPSWHLTAVGAVSSAVAVHGCRSLPVAQLFSLGGFA